MSDTRGKLKQEGVAQGVIEDDLSNLSASKHLHTNSPGEVKREPANSIDPQPDLASVSISGTDVARSSAPISGQPRIISSPGRQSPHPSTERATSQTLSTKNSRPSGAGTKQEFGVFKNPAYSYGGDIVSKIIAFFANLLKVLERLLLRLVGGGERAAPPPGAQKSSNPAQPNNQRAEEQAEREKQRRKQQSGLGLTHKGDG
ncbi:MAG: hypothetical protein ACK5Y6_09000 [Pseudomonadota bacterium]|jgi:hypothetical protein